jgi:hypothetical protein
MGWVFFILFFLPFLVFLFFIFLSLGCINWVRLHWWNDDWWVKPEVFQRKTCPIDTVCTTSAIAMCKEVWCSCMFQWFNIISHWISATRVKLLEIWGFRHGVGEGIAVLGVTTHKSEGNNLDLTTDPAVELLCLECFTCVVLFFLLSSKF